MKHQDIRYNSYWQQTSTNHWRGLFFNALATGYIVEFNGIYRGFIDFHYSPSQFIIESININTVKDRLLKTATDIIIDTANYINSMQVDHRTINRGIELNKDI